MIDDCDSRSLLRSEFIIELIAHFEEWKSICLSKEINFYKSLFITK